MMTQAIDLDHPVLAFTHHWVNTLAKHFDHVHVISRIGGRMNLAPNVSIYPYAKPTQIDMPYQRHLFFQRKLSHLILGNQIDTIFIHMIPKWVMLAYPYAKIKRLPLSLWYTHASVNGRLKIADRLVNQVFTASKESYLLKSPHLNVLGHGIDTHYFKPIEGDLKGNGRFHIIMPGRISPAKQPHLLVDAIQELSPKLQEKICCQFIGGAATHSDLVYQKNLQEKVHAHGLSNSIQFLGPIPFEKMVSHYQTADLAVNLSKTNSLDKTVLEAMACGIPPLTSNPAFEPILSAIEPQLTLKHDDPVNLIQGLTFWIDSSLSKRQQIGKQLRQEVVNNHNLHSMIEKLAQLLKRGGK